MNHPPTANRCQSPTGPDRPIGPSEVSDFNENLGLDSARCADFMGDNQTTCEKRNSVRINCC